MRLMPAAGALLALLALAPGARGAPRLDPAFGDNGVVKVRAGGLDHLGAALVLGDGSVVVSASSHSSVGFARFTPTGAPDPSFGEGGVRRGAVRGASDGYGYVVRGLAVDGMDRLVTSYHDMAGFGGHGAQDSRVCIASTDQSGADFSSGAACGRWDGVTELVAEDRSLLVAANRRGHYVVDRLDPAGELDASWTSGDLGHTRGSDGAALGSGPGGLYAATVSSRGAEIRRLSTRGRPLRTTHVPRRRGDRPGSPALASAAGTLVVATPVINPRRRRCALDVTRIAEGAPRSRVTTVRRRMRRCLNDVAVVARADGGATVVGLGDATKADARHRVDDDLPAASRLVVVPVSPRGAIGRPAALPVFADIGAFIASAGRQPSGRLVVAAHVSNFGVPVLVGIAD